MILIGYDCLDSRTDENLVIEIGKGHMPALAELVRRHQQRALQVAYRSLGDWQLAEDVVQEGFLRVHRAAKRYRPDAKFSTWFYRVIVNLCMDQLRKQQRQSSLVSRDGGGQNTSVADPLRCQEVKEIQQAVQRALECLNERERMTVILHRFEGQTHVQIAEIMEASVSAIESLLVRAYRKLRGELALYSGNQEKRMQDSA